MKSLIFACCLLLLSIVTVKADLPKPKPPERVAKHVLHTGLEISTDPKAYEAKLQISESDLKNFQAALNGVPGDTSIAANIVQSRTRTIIAGLLMFLSVSIAGVLFARSASLRPRQKAVMGVILAAVVIGAAAMISRGNAGPPGSYRWRTLPQALAEGKPTTGGVDVEIMPDNVMDGRMRLIIPLKKQNGSGDE